MSTSAAYDPKGHIEKVLDELADLMEAESEAGRVGAELVDKFNHLVNTWNLARKSLGSHRHRGDYRQAPEPSVQVEERVVESSAPVVFNPALEVIASERLPLATVQVSDGIINLVPSLKLCEKSKTLIMQGAVLPVENDKDLKLLAYYLNLFRLR